MSAKLNALIRQLSTSEDLARYEDDLLQFGDRAVAPLLAILQDRSTWHDDAPGGGVAPAKAARLLGRMRAPEAVEPLLEALEVLEPDEILYDAVMQALSAYGEHIVETALEHARAARDEHADLHEALTGVLVGSGVRDARIEAELRVVVRRDPHVGQAYLDWYGDPELARALAHPAAPARKQARNAPCWCGSGRRYKACHAAADEA